MDADIHSLGTRLESHKAQEFTCDRKTTLVIDQVIHGYELLETKKGWLISKDEEEEDVDPELDETEVEGADLVS